MAMRLASNLTLLSECVVSNTECTWALQYSSSHMAQREPIFTPLVGLFSGSSHGLPQQAISSNSLQQSLANSASTGTWICATRPFTLLASSLTFSLVRVTPFLIERNSQRCLRAVRLLYRMLHYRHTPPPPKLVPRMLVKRRVAHQHVAVVD